jgi:hypothetical protein
VVALPGGTSRQRLCFPRVGPGAEMSELSELSELSSERAGPTIGDSVVRTNMRDKRGEGMCEQACYSY